MAHLIVSPSMKMNKLSNGGVCSFASLIVQLSNWPSKLEVDQPLTLLLVLLSMSFFGGEHSLLLFCSNYTLDGNNTRDINYLDPWIPAPVSIPLLAMCLCNVCSDSRRTLAY